MCSLMLSKNSILEYFLEMGKNVNIFKILLFFSVNIQMGEKNDGTLGADVY